MLMKPLLHFNQIHLFAKYLQQDNIDLIRGEVGYNTLFCTNDKIIPVSDLLDKKANNIIKAKLRAQEACTRGPHRPIRLTQCCTQFRSPGVKILLLLHLHCYVAFTFE